MRIAILLLALALAPGCAALSSVCDTVLPAINTGQTLLDDAIVHTKQAKVIVQSITDPEARAKAESLIAQAEQGLTDARESLEAAGQACESPNYDTVFALFLQVWKELRLIIGLVGGGISDPLVFKR